MIALKNGPEAIHLLPGRLRARLPGLLGRRRLALQVELCLHRAVGVRTARANPHSGHVLICYNPCQVTAAGVMHLLAVGQQSGWQVGRPAWQREVAVALQESTPPEVAAGGWPGGWTGLSEAEARRGLLKFGPNLLHEAPRPSFWTRLLQQFCDPMVITLLAGAGISLIAGRVRDAVTITAILALNAVVGAGQAGKAEGSLAALRKMSAPKAKVVREGRVVTMKAAGLVPGDTLLLEAGDKVPADALLLWAVATEAEESMLTGESVPVEKQPAAPGAPPEGGIGRRDMLFAGTTLTRGRCIARVTATGMKTEMGRIAALLGQVKEGPTPLQDRMDELGRTMVKGSLLVCGAVALAGLLRGIPLGEMLLTAVSLAVAAIPEGLPTFVTLGLATGVRQMARRNAIVRRLQAVETLGSATVICTDKTGTLTRNQMTARQMFAGGRLYDVSGSGYSADGDFLLDGERIQPLADPDLARLLSVGALCNNAVLEQRRDARGRRRTYEVRGDATEGALLVAAVKAGLHLAQHTCDHVRVTEVPFDSTSRRMSVICRGPDGLCLYTKGAPEALLQVCSHIMYNGEAIPLDAALRQQVLAAADAMAERAYRVLGSAYRPLASETVESTDDGSIFLGLTGLVDPPREEVPSALVRCRRAGIRVIMLTGDHPRTAEAVAREIGLLEPGGLLLTGDDVAHMSDVALRRCIGRLQVCARVSPEQKLRVVRALRSQHEVVAMTGDGVNDAPAVKEADIGVAMGRAGTEVTKEAAALVLADDNFATIVAAIEMGRVTYNNIRKSIRYLLASNTGEMLVMASAILLGLPLPLIPLQILWLNLVGDGLPALALGTEPANGMEMSLTPRPRSESIFAGGLGRRILAHGLRMGAAALGIFIWALSSGRPLAVVRTLMLCTLVIGQLIYLWRCRYETGQSSVVRSGSNPVVTWAAVASGALLVGSIHLASLNRLLQLVPLRAGEWAIAGLGAAAGAL